MRQLLEVYSKEICDEENNRLKAILFNTEDELKIEIDSTSARYILTTATVIKNSYSLSSNFFPLFEDPIVFPLFQMVYCLQVIVNLNHDRQSNLLKDDCQSSFYASIQCFFSL